MYVTLRCQTCDNIDCPIARLYVPYDSLEGCTREVTEDLAAQYTHAIEEVLPFAKTSSQFDSVEQTLNEIYQSSIGRKLDAKGKALPQHQRLAATETPNGSKDTPDNTEHTLQAPRQESEQTHSIDILRL